MASLQGYSEFVLVSLGFSESMTICVACVTLPVDAH